LFRTRVIIGDKLPYGYGRTKHAAIRSRITGMKKVQAKYPDECMDEFKADIRTLTIALSRYKKKNLVT